MFPILNERTVLLVGTLRAKLYEAEQRDAVPDAEAWALVDDLCQALTPDFQSTSLPQFDDDGVPLVKIATCGTCGRSWDDALVSSLTPVPSGRCPFEYDHDGIDRDEIQEALEGDSNDAEHDALVSVADALGIRYTVPEW